MVNEFKKQLKVLHTADWHIGTFKSPVRDGRNLRSEDTKNCLNEIVRVARDERPDYTLISGDVFDVGRLMSDRCCEEIVTAGYYIRELAAASKQVIVMRGTPNHDGAGQFNVLSEMFAGCQNVHIVTTPQVISFDDLDIAVVPGFERGFYRAKYPEISKEDENEVFTQELSNIVCGLKAQCDGNKTSILMTHYTVPGCNTESGQTMLLAQFEPVIPQEALLAADYDLVALGHIHRPQQIETNAWFYSGAINAMNFNDEGQERGFWIHELLPDGGGWNHTFHKTPYREFITFHFTDTDITAINLGCIDEVAVNYWRRNGAVQDKIVRVRYSCSVEAQKAFNSVILEKALLEDGAFMVWDILQDQIDEFANRTELAVTTEPEANLIEYLKEKQFPEEKIQELVLKARPVIAEAEAGMPAAANTGTFEPVEISVENYRNYEEESFNFNDISFCTINGPNGAGKSSLFMDAILDCLYEEPREGFLKDDAGKSPWLRNDEKVRRGAIMFTFRIGEKTYRVTRTRARSGKGTLNIAQLIDGEWNDCSKERYNDTQQEILNILGMDSLTFKSCALIMQDQYGLFLQAKPEERVDVLSTLLGLGVYQMMEKIAEKKAKVFSAGTTELKQKVEVHMNTISGLGKPDEELATCEQELAAEEIRLREKTAERDKSKLQLAHQQEAVERRRKLLVSINNLQTKRAAAEQNKAAQQAIIDNASVILECRAEIEAKVAEYNSMLEKEKSLAAESALYSAKKKEAESFAEQEESEQASLDRMKQEEALKNAELAGLQPTDQDEAIRERAAEYEKQKQLLEAAYEKERAYRAVERRLVQEKYELSRIDAHNESLVNGLRLKEEGLRKKAELLLNVECVDIENAKCGFLADAISAKALLEKCPALYEERKTAYEAETEPVREKIAALEKEMSDMKYDAGMVTSISAKIAELKPYLFQLEELNRRESRIALIKARLDNLQSNILETEKRLSMVKLRGMEAVQERDRYAQSFEEHISVQNAILRLKPWMEKEKRLPVEEERKATAMSRILELIAEISDIDAEIAEEQSEAGRESDAAIGLYELQAVVNNLEAEVSTISSAVKKQQIRVGELQQKAKQIEELKKEILELQKCQAESAKEAVDYETLKNAFSQSGVPHQIIRSIIPRLTEISNNILGQMTGGKMGVEFRLERLQKNGKEKGSLDIFIEECGKAALPYLSKSGGEKVKSSLSVILALAEIKSSCAGVRLGMLFIDEPPFLDGDGMQAYCDALETIQSRYNNIKIMAITHDPAMKARFPQNLDVVKTEHGSKVVY